MADATMTDATPTLAVEVVTYNVLCSALGDKDQYPLCDPNACSVRFRGQQLMCKMETQMRNRRIICLQEVCTPWWGMIEPLSKEFGYKSIVSLYGPDRHRNMGTAILWPGELYDLDGRVNRKLIDFDYDFEKHHLVKDDGSETALGDAVNRPNHILGVELFDRATEKRFCVFTYHVPMAVYEPAIMIMHAVHLVEWAKQFAHDAPLILAGDFNSKPDEPVYKLITGDVPSNESLTKWVQAMPGMGCDRFCLHKDATMTSAYKDCTGSEPAYTNHAFSSWKGAPGKWFTETIDYIFMSKHWRCSTVGALPDKKPGEKDPQPTLTEPSDHLLLWARLELKSDATD